ncbi:unnamed protein product [Parajaminaea phylloscopi]
MLVFVRQSLALLCVVAALLAPSSPAWAQMARSHHRGRAFFETLRLPPVNPAPQVRPPTFPAGIFGIPQVVKQGPTAFLNFTANSNKRLASPDQALAAKTKKGTFHGMRAPFIFQQQWWLGVPFAKPPVGDLRFRAPQPLDDSTQDFAATATKPTCWQPNGYLMGFNGDDGQRNEDCLYLNIYTPNNAERNPGKLPVLLWYFGGGEIGGTASSYNSTALEILSILAGQPIIVVTPQYRLNAFGFMAGKPYADAARAGKVDLNPGLQDVTAALDWTYENIAAFGGDPERITIAGQSSGAFNVGAQLLKDGKPGAPPPKYRNAIMLSGTMGSEPAFAPDSDITTKTFQRVAAAVGCASGDQIECLRKAKPIDLAEATFPDLKPGQRPDVATVLGPDFYPGIFMYQPVQDGVYHRDGAGAQVRRGEFPDVPVLTGNTKDEGTIFVQQTGRAQDWPSWLAKVAFESQDTSQPGSQQFLDRVVTAYPDVPRQGAPYWPAWNKNDSRFGAGAQFERCASTLGDQAWHSQRRLFLEQHNKYKKSKAFAYLFNQTNAPPDVNDWVGIPHGYDPTYWFAAYAFLPNPFYLAQSATSRDAALSMISFVNRGDPNHFGMLQWPPYTQATKQLFRFQGNNNILIKDDFRPEMSVLSEPASLALVSR